MTDKWVSVGKTWCQYCRIFVYNNSVMQKKHETSERHKLAVTKFLSNKKKEKTKKESEDRELQNKIRELEHIAMSKVFQDISNGEGGGTPQFDPHGNVTNLNQQQHYGSNRTWGTGAVITGTNSFDYSAHKQYFNSEEYKNFFETFVKPNQEKAKEEEMKKQKGQGDKTATEPNESKETQDQEIPQTEVEKEPEPKSKKAIVRAKPTEVSHEKEEKKERININISLPDDTFISTTPPEVTSDPKLCEVTGLFAPWQPVQKGEEVWRDEEEEGEQEENQSEQAGQDSDSDSEPENSISHFEEKTPFQKDGDEEESEEPITFKRKIGLQNKKNFRRKTS